jgi:RecA/RadA recombinase
MAQKKLVRVPGLPEDAVRAMKEKKFVVADDVFRRIPFELLHTLDIPYSSIQETLRAVASSVAPECKSALTLYHEWNSSQGSALCTGLTELDEALRGGIPRGSITELVGTPGAGKTQMCISLAAMTVCSKLHGGLDGSVLYIDAERKFNPQRMQEITASRLRIDTAQAHALIDRCTVLKPNTSVELSTYLSNLEEKIVEDNVKVCT